MHYVSDTINDAPAVNALRGRKVWLNWKYRRRPDGSWTKPPIDAQGRLIDPTDSMNWLSFDDAYLNWVLGPADGIGIALEYASGLVAIDLDRCIANGRCDPAILDNIVRPLESYTEISPSGRGLRILCWANLPGPIRLKRGRCEIYNTSGYVTLTGNCGRHPRPINHRTAEVTDLLRRLGASEADTQARLKVVGGIDLEPGLAEIDVADLRITPRMKEVLRTGEGDYDSRSHAVWGALMSMIGAGHTDQEIRFVLTNPENALAAKPIERGARWLDSEIRRARAKALVHRRGGEFEALEALP